jgi:hypothetical protein
MPSLRIGREQNMICESASLSVVSARSSYLRRVCLSGALSAARSVLLQELLEELQHPARMAFSGVDASVIVNMYMYL